MQYQEYNTVLVLNKKTADGESRTKRKKVIKPLMFFFEYKLACARNLWRRSFLQYG
jgi:hypothetical protein